MDFEKPSRLQIAFIGGFLIFTVSILAYFIFIPKLGFYIDDWNIAYTGYVEGSQKLIEVFAMDRPFRAYLVGFMFQLFGLNAAFHGYASFFLRFIVSLGAFWLFYQILPKHKWVSVFLASLFAVYPGFLEQTIGLDFQSHHVALALEIFSIAIMVFAWNCSRRWAQVLLILVSVIFSLLCYLLMEIYIGLEILRFIILIYLACDGKDIKTLFIRPRRGLRKAALFWTPYLVGSIAFLVWRIFIFHSDRASTDIPALMTKFTSSIFLSSASLGFGLIRSFINVVISSWIVPFYYRLESLRLRDSLLVAFLGIIGGIIVYFTWKWFIRKNGDPNSGGKKYLSSWLLLMGTFCVLGTLAPSVFGEREVNFESYSRFAYPGAIGAVLIIWALLLKTRNFRFQGLLLSIMIGLSITTHAANSIYYAQWWESVRTFWWQVSWRIPQIKPESMIVAHYSNAPIREDYDVRGPADLIFYPESYKPDGVTRSPIGSIVLTKDNIYAIQAGEVLQDRTKRGVVSNQDLRNPLIISMPQTGSCVHVLDGNAPELSRYEDLSIQLIAKYSDMERIDLTDSGHVPPEALFGREPERKWCYYYEKASLARQNKDWQEVARLGNEAVEKKLHPLDRIEWLPFLQAYAYLGETDRVKDLSPIILEDPYLTTQVCGLFSKSDSSLDATQLKGRDLLKNIFCK